MAAGEWVGVCDGVETTTIWNEDIAVTLLRAGELTEFRGVGVAIRHPDDEPDEGLGVLLSGGRAFQELGWAMEQKALRRAGVFG